MATRSTTKRTTRGSGGTKTKGPAKKPAATKRTMSRGTSRSR